MSEEKKVLMARIVKKNPEEKLYLICIRGKDGESDAWDIVEGRTEAYEYIKQNIEWMDLDESFILVETAQFKERKKIYTFMKYAEQFYEEDNFDIEDYVVGDQVIEQDMEETKDNTVTSQFTEPKLSMQSFMDNEIESVDIN